MKHQISLVFTGVYLLSSVHCIYIALYNRFSGTWKHLENKENLLQPIKLFQKLKINFKSFDDTSKISVVFLKISPILFDELQSKPESSLQTSMYTTLYSLDSCVSSKVASNPYRPTAQHDIIQNIYLDTYSVSCQMQ